MAAWKLAQERRLGLASGLGVRTAGMKWATGRRMHGRRGLSGQEQALLIGMTIEHGHR
jgi:hypothetical protein